MFVVHIPYTGVTTTWSRKCQNLHEKCSRNSKHASNCITTRLMTTRQRKNQSSIHSETNSYLHVFRLLSSPKIPIQMTMAVIYLGIRQTRRQANHSPPFGAEVKNEWIYNFNSHTSSWDSAYLSTGATLPPIFVSTVPLRTEINDTWQTQIPR
jgi:hypothetical protein